MFDAGYDTYVYPGTNVLRNRLGIRDAEQLQRAEASISVLRALQLEERQRPARYDLRHLQAVHRYLFEPVYEWAGQLRTVSLGKGALFCLPQHLVVVGDEIFGELARNGYLRNLGRADFLDGVTELTAKLNALHPFREGNGRTQRAFLGQLARDAGHPLHWSGMDSAVNVVASQAAHRSGDLGPLQRMLDELVDRPADPDSTGGNPPPRAHA